MHLPAPKLVVFYNGSSDRDDTVLRLSDAFAPDADYDIEVRVRMVNINPGRNVLLMRQCAPLAEYAWLTDRIRSYRLHMDIADAVDAALDDMPESFLIRPSLFANRAEVKNMCITEYNETETMQLFREEGRREGRREGLAEAEARFGRLMSLLLAEGRTEDAQKASVDSHFRTQLYRKYGIL